MTSMRTIFRSSTVRVLGIGLLVSLAVVFCRQFGFLETFELGAYDWMVRQAPSPVTPDPRIVLITITEEDLQHLGQWPISDEHIAQALKILTGYGARTIGLDLYRDREVPPGRGELNSVFAKHSEIVTVMKFPDQHGEGVPGPPILQETDQIGFNDILVDPGGIVRRGFLFLEDEKGTAISFSLLLALKYLEKDGIVPHPDPTRPELMRIGTTTIPRFQSNDGGYVKSDAKGYQMLVKYSGTYDSFSRFSLTTLLSGRVEREAIEKKIVVIGSAAKSVRDDFYTPLSSGREQNQQVPGVELHAQFVSQFVRMALEHEPPIRTLTEYREVGWIFIWGSLGGLLGLRLFFPWRLLVLLGGGVGGIVLFVYWAFLVNWWIPVVPSAMAWLIGGSVATAWRSKRDRQEQSLLMQLFSQHVSREVADTIWAGREQYLHDGRIRPQKLTATILFADLEGSTAVAERLDPQVLMEWINTYLTSMANVIAAHEGVVDDFFGDGVKANFGVPVARTKHEDIRQDAINAMQCGVALQDEIHRLNQIHRQQDLPVGKVRIGIATGSVVVGTVGNAHRLKYTTVGDIVNIAARLEQLGKDNTVVKKDEEFGSLLVSKETHGFLDVRWKTQEVGQVNLPGKQEPVTVLRVLSGPQKRIALNS